MYGTYRNRHNNREMTIDKMEISDEGTKFWYAGEYDMFTERCLERNWDMVSELGTPEPAMTDMESLRLRLKNTRDSIFAKIEEEGHLHPNDYTKLREIDAGWVEGLDYAIEQIEQGFLEGGE